MGFPFTSIVDNQLGLYWNRYRCNCRMIILQNIHLQYTLLFVCAHFRFSFDSLCAFRAYIFAHSFRVLFFSLRFAKVCRTLYALLANANCRLCILLQWLFTKRMPFLRSVSKLYEVPKSYALSRSFFFSPNSTYLNFVHSLPFAFYLLSSLFFFFFYFGFLKLFYCSFYI